MKLKIYASFDKLTNELNSRTFMAPNEDVAKNIVEGGFYGHDGKLDHNAIRNAKNYNLCELGTHDTECGITGLGNEFRTVCSFADLIPAQTEIQDKQN